MAFASPASRQRKGELKGAAAASPLSSSPSRTALSAHQHYVSTHNVSELFTDALEALLRQEPSQPAAFLAAHFSQATGGVSASATSGDTSGSVAGARLEAALDAALADPACRAAFVHAFATAAQDDLAAVLREPSTTQPAGEAEAKPSQAAEPSQQEEQQPRRGAPLKRQASVVGIAPTAFDRTIETLSGDALMERLLEEPALASRGGMITQKGEQLYLGGAFGRDGCLYLVPAKAARVARFDPATGKVTYIGDDFGESDRIKWAGGVLCEDGLIYALPNYAATRVLRIDPAKGTAERFGDDVKSLNCPAGWAGTTQGPDGKLYAVPGASTSVLCFDPATGQLSTFGDLPEGGWKHAGGGVLAPDGCIYAAPFIGTTHVLRIDPVERTATHIGDDVKQAGEAKWFTGAVGADGRLYFPPFVATRVLRIDPTTHTVELIGEELGGGKKWLGAFTGPDGCVYGTPCDETQLLRIDPFAGTAARVGPPLEEPPKGKLVGTAVAADGTVWALPHKGPSTPHRIELPPVRQLLGALMRAPPDALLGALHSDARRGRLLSMLAVTAESGDAEGVALSRGCLLAAAAALPQCVADAAAQSALVTLLDALSEPTLVCSGKDSPCKTNAAYHGGVFGHDGLLYLIPRNARRVARFDPTTGKWEEIGDDLGEDGEKYIGGALCDDGSIIALPGKSSRALRIDPAKGTAAPFGDDLSALGRKDFNWHGTVMAPDGMLIGVPLQSRSVLCFEWATGKASIFGELPDDASMYTDGVLADDGCIYCSPWVGKRALCIDPTARTVALIGDELGATGGAWLDGALGGDGCLYFPPHAATRVLRIDPTTQRVELIGEELGGGGKWLGAFTGPDGCVYGIPSSETQLLRIDPFAGTAARVGPPLEEPPRGKLLGTAVAADGTVWALPHKGPSTPHRFDLPPFEALPPLLADDDALRTVLSCDKLRPSCTRLLGSAAVLCQNATTEQKALGELVRTRLHPAFAAAATQGAGLGLSSSAHATMLDTIVQVSPYLTGLVTWTPAPTSTDDWLRPAKQPGCALLDRTLRAIEASGPAALDAAWAHIAPVGAEALARIVAAVRESSQAQAVLLELYEKERKMSLENYKGPLLRCRREPTYFEYERQSQKLRTALAERSQQCRQLESHFPRLIQQATATEPTFVDFVQLLSQRTRAEAGLPPEKPSRQQGRCLKGAWRVIEKMALRPGAIPEGGLDGMPPKQVLSEVLDASRLFDILRGSIKCDDFTQLVAVLDLLLLLDEEMGNPDKARSMGIPLERFAIRLHRFKCRFTRPTSGGWADALANFSFASDPHKHVVELQLQVRPAPRALPVSCPAHSPFPPRSTRRCSSFARRAGRTRHTPASARLLSCSRRSARRRLTSLTRRARSTICRPSRRCGGRWRRWRSG